MEIIKQRKVAWKRLPECCGVCKHLYDNDGPGMIEIAHYFCELNIFLPVKKGDCARWVKHPAYSGESGFENKA